METLKARSLHPSTYIISKHSSKLDASEATCLVYPLLTGLFRGSQANWTRKQDQLAISCDDLRHCARQYGLDHDIIIKTVAPYLHNFRLYFIRTLIPQHCGMASDRPATISSASCVVQYSIFTIPGRPKLGAG